jgi:hypothetical protein
MQCFLIFLITDVVNGGISIFGCIQPGEVAKLRRIFQQKNQGGCSKSRRISGDLLCKAISEIRHI